MIQMQSKLKSADNSGAKVLKCIKVLGGSKKMSADVGDVIKVSVVSVVAGSKLKKGSVYDAVVVRTKSPISRQDGSSVRFSDNAAVLLNEAGELDATRVFGPIPRELRYKGYMKVISLAPEVV